MTRKLASIQKISDIVDVGLDNLELAKTLGWQFLVSKGQYKVGDLFVYVEYDSIFPKEHEYSKHWEFMSKYNYRVRTIKMRGHISQGVALPLSIFPEYIKAGFSEGDDVTNFLGIQKKEDFEVKLGGKIASNFPSFISKTDETRIQSVPEVLDEIREHNLPMYSTIKYDGSSMTVYLKKIDENLLHFGVCSRNFEFKLDDDNDFVNLAKDYNLEDILMRHHLETNDELALQMEAVGGGFKGSGVYANATGLQKKEIRIFNIYSITNKKYYSLSEMLRFCSIWNLPNVKIVGYYGYIEPFNLALDDIIKIPLEMKYPNTDNYIEGLVFRTIDNNYYSEVMRSRLSFKVINNNFLLKGQK